MEWTMGGANFRYDANCVHDGFIDVDTMDLIREVLSVELFHKHRGE